MTLMTLMLSFWGARMSEQNFIEDNLIILSKQTLDAFLKQKHPADLIAVYAFYYYTAKWQKTNQIKCTTIFVATGLGIGERKVRAIKKKLIELGLIEDVVRRNAETNKVESHYIKINYLWKSHPCKNESVDTKATPAESHTVEKRKTNSLSANSLNALNVNNKNIQKDIFESCRKLYPGVKRGLDTEFKAFQKHRDWQKVLPLLEIAIVQQIDWRKNANGEFRPAWKHFQVWIHQRYWEMELQTSGLKSAGVFGTGGLSAREIVAAEKEGV